MRAKYLPNESGRGRPPSLDLQEVTIPKSTMPLWCQTKSNETSPRNSRSREGTPRENDIFWLHGETSGMSKVSRKQFSSIRSDPVVGLWVSITFFILIPRPSFQNHVAACFWTNGFVLERFAPRGIRFRGAENGPWKSAHFWSKFRQIRTFHFLHEEEGRPDDTPF